MKKKIVKVSSKRDLDESISYKNKKGEVVASYNPLYQTIYVGNNATEEDIEKFKRELTEKKYKVRVSFKAKN